MRSMILLCTVFWALAFVATAAHAQPRKKSAPPPPPPAAHETVSLPAGTPPVPEMNTTGMPTADQPLLTRETEVRRGLHFEAFVDAQGALVNKNWYPGRGFTLNDAALYLSKEFTHGLSAMIDLPFASSSTATGTSIGFGASRAQGYVQWLTGPWQAKFGQFDSIFGYEKNDSRDRFFADAGLVKSIMLPATYVGALGGFSAGQFTVRAQLTDPHDTETMANVNPELGLQARFDGQPVFAAAGFTINDSKTADGSNMLIDLMAGVKMDKLMGAVYFDDLKTAGVDKHGDGFGVQGAYNVSADLGLGARVEYASDVTDNTIGAAVPMKSMFEVSAGPSYRWLPDLTVRADVDFASLSPVTGDSSTLFGLQGSIVASF